MRIIDIIHKIVCAYNKHNDNPTGRDIQNILFVLDIRMEYVDLRFIKYSSGPYNRRVEDSLDDGSMDHAFHINNNTIELCNCPMNEYKRTDLSSKTERVIESIVNEYRNCDCTKFVEKLRNNGEYQSIAKYEPIDISQIDL